MKIHDSRGRNYFLHEVGDGRLIFSDGFVEGFVKNLYLDYASNLKVDFYNKAEVIHFESPGIVMAII